MTLHRSTVLWGLAAAAVYIGWKYNQGGGTAAGGNSLANTAIGSLSDPWFYAFVGIGAFVNFTVST